MSNSNNSGSKFDTLDKLSIGTIALGTGEIGRRELAHSMVSRNAKKIAEAKAREARESGASRSSSSEMNSRAADLAEKSRKARSEYIPGMKKLGNTPDNPAGKPSSSITMDKLRSAASHAKDTAKELYGQFSHSPKAQMIAGGTAAALGAGLAAKRYLQRKKKK